MKRGAPCRCEQSDWSTSTYKNGPQIPFNQPLRRQTGGTFMIK